MTTRLSATGAVTLERPPAPSRRRTMAPVMHAPESAYTILLAAENEDAAATIASGLAVLDRAHIRRVDDIYAIAPDLARAGASAAIIACNRPTAQVIAALRAIKSACALATILFVAHGDQNEIDAAIAAGVTSLVVDGLYAARIAPVLQVALCRFKAQETLHAELARAKSDLAARKTIERAKGILMERRRLSEADAYAMLRRLAMQDGKTIAEIAEAIMAADRLLTA